MLNVVLNAELGECGDRMWNYMAFNFDRHLQMLMSLEPDNISRNIYGVLTGFLVLSLKKIKIFISYTL